MTIDLSSVASFAAAVLLFPTLFENTMLAFVWGALDEPWLMVLKRVFLLLPAGAILLALWTSILCLLSVVVRQKRSVFIRAFLVTWWDLGKSILAFWAGLFRFVLVLANSLFGFLRIAVTALWLFLQDLLLAPFRLVQSVARNVSVPGLPWIAATLTLVWCLAEAVVFTYVMTPLVQDTLDNLTGGELSEALIRIPLFLFLLFLVLGSYAVLSNWTEAVKSRKVLAILKITAVEAVAILVEVMFLYRELVDSLVPWFAQHTSKDFDLGITGTLAIAFLAWLGVRGMTWFLFAGHGVPVITAVIQGRGLRSPKPEEPAPTREALPYVMGFYSTLKADMDWIQEKGDELLAAFLLPPLQVAAAALNFITLLVGGRHLFDLPFKTIRDLVRSRELIQGAVPHPRRIRKEVKKEVKKAEPEPVAQAQEVHS
jgi:hypothetical protein